MSKCPEEVSSVNVTAELKIHEICGLGHIENNDAMTSASLRPQNLTLWNGDL